jgi:hypothetical protein
MIILLIISINIIILAIDLVPELLTKFQNLINSYHMDEVIEAMVSDGSAINKLKTNLITYVFILYYI